MRLKDVAVGAFELIATDEELLNLLEVPTRSMKDIREQIVEDKYPNDLVVNSLSRLCVYENPTTKFSYSVVEKSFIEIDIYVTKEKNKIDRRVLLVANRLFEILHNKNIEGFQVTYYNRLPNLPTDNKEWVKYGVVFTYDNFIV